MTDKFFTKSDLPRLEALAERREIDAPNHAALVKLMVAYLAKPSVYTARLSMDDLCILLNEKYKLKHDHTVFWVRQKPFSSKPGSSRLYEMIVEDDINGEFLELLSINKDRSFHEDELSNEKNSSTWVPVIDVLIDRLDQRVFYKLKDKGSIKEGYDYIQEKKGSRICINKHRIPEIQNMVSQHPRRRLVTPLVRNLSLHRAIEGNYQKAAKVPENVHSPKVLKESIEERIERILQILEGKVDLQQYPA